MEDIEMEKKIRKVKVCECRFEAEKHKVPGTINRCIDERYSKGTAENVARETGLDVDQCDRPTFAGGALRLAGLDEKSSGEEWALAELATSIKLHHPEQVVLVVHDDCGWLKAQGLKFDTPEQEQEFLIKAAERAALNLASYLEQQGIAIPEIAPLVMLKHQ
jgi:hypothetical protein